MNKRRAPAVAAVLACLLLHPAGHAADEAALERLALCQDSWLEWKDETRLARLVADVERHFDPGSQAGGFTPKAPTTLLGARVTRLFPQSVGTGVGFSVLVEVDAAQARKAVERHWGRSMVCKTDGGDRACQLELSPQKVAVLMTGDGGRSRTSLLGCYYIYQP